jgi:hypothetical protein
MAADLDRLLDEAERQPLVGWDFSWLGDRRRVRPVAWDFSTLVIERARASPDLLDMGTGGGEWLSQLPVRPLRTVAIEGWAPNVPIAARRLQKLGVPAAPRRATPADADQWAAHRSSAPLLARRPHTDRRMAARIHVPAALTHREPPGITFQ